MELELKTAKITASERAYYIEKANNDLYKKEVEYVLKVMKIRAEAGQSERDDELMTLREMAAAREIFFKSREDLNKSTSKRIQNYNNEDRDILLKSLEDQYAKGLVKEQDYQIRRQQIIDASAKHVLEAQLKEAENQLAIDRERNGFLPVGKQIDTTSLEATTANLRLQIAHNEDKDAEDLAKKKKERAKDLRDKEIEFAQKAFDVIGGLVEGNFQKEIEASQKKIDANNKAKDTEVANIQASQMSASQKAAAIQELEKQTAQRNAIEQKKQHDIKVKEAEFEKAKAILDIGVATERAVAKSLLEASILASNPLTAPLAAQAYTMAGIEAGIGLAEIAAVAAKKIPSFYAGTDHAPEGLALTDEKGPELYETPSGEVFFGNNKPTYRYLEEGTKITSYDEVQKMLLQGILFSASPMHVDKNGEIIKGLADLKQEIKRTSQEQINAMRKQKAPDINIYNDAEFVAHIKRSI